MYAMLDENDQLVNGNPIAIYRRPEAITFTENGEEYQAPANWMQLWSLQEKNDKHIFPLVTNTIDSNQERESGAPYTYTFDGTNISETIPTQDLTLDGYRTVKMRELLGERDAEATQDIVVTIATVDTTFEATTFITTLAADVITQLSAGGTFPADFRWATKDNVPMALTENQMKQLASLMLNQRYQAQRQYWILKKAVEDATTKAEIQAITWV